jgi:RNA polymerase primary sigma factor
MIATLTNELSQPPVSKASPRRSAADNSPEGFRAYEADCVYDPSFALPGAQEQYAGPNMTEIPVPDYSLLPEFSEDSTTENVKRPLLTGAQERLLFLRYNYAKYCLAKLMAARRDPAPAQWHRDVEQWRRRVQDMRTAIVNANLALVPAMASRVNFSGVETSELISEGYMAVLRSIEKFDVSRGFKFSTYACRAILKSFHRFASKARRYRDHFPVEFDPKFERSDFEERRHRQGRNDAIEAVREVLFQNGADLSELGRTVILERFPIHTQDKPRTLAEVGKVVGLTNERVRQIEKKSLVKIRAALQKADAM